MDEDDYNDDIDSFDEISDAELDEMEDVEVEDYRREELTYDDEDEEDEDTPETDEDGVSVEEETDLDDEEPEEEEEAPKEEKKKRTITETVWDWELINDTKAIWLRPKSEIEEQEYFDFYKSITKDNDEPLTYNHFTAEGDIEFKSILFIPTHSSYDLFENYYGSSGAMKLYVRRVMISD